MGRGRCLDVTAGWVGADLRARRRRTLPPEQRALPIVALAELDAVYGYSFIVTNRDVSTSGKAAVVEHWYWHQTQIEDIFRDVKRRRSASSSIGVSPGQSCVDVSARCSPPAAILVTAAARAKP